MKKTYALSQLNRKLEAKHREVVFSERAVRGDRVSVRLQLAMIRMVLDWSASAKPHRLAEDELLCDRLMLSVSAQYRATRERAAELGISLKPALQSLPRSLEQFHPKQNVFPFSPIESELRWAVRTTGAPETETLDQVLSILRYASSIYHDLNHAIVFRLVRPKPSQTLLYYRWCESLARIRDIQLAEELGLLASPLSVLRVAYQDAGNRKLGSCLADFEVFQRLQLHIFLENTLLPEKKIRALLRRAGLSECDHPLRKTNKDFLEDTVPSWEGLHKLSLSGPLPKKQPTLKLGSIEPTAYLRNRDEHLMLFHWYQRVWMKSDVRL